MLYEVITMLDLAREDVHAPDDQEVVGTAEEAVYSPRGAAAAAGFRDDEGDVPGAVADEGSYNFV